LLQYSRPSAGVQEHVVLPHWVLFFIFDLLSFSRGTQLLKRQYLLLPAPSQVFSGIQSGSKREAWLSSTQVLLEYKKKAGFGIAPCMCVH